MIYVETAAASVSFLLQLILLLPHKCISKLKAERYIISKEFFGKRRRVRRRSSIYRVIFQGADGKICRPG